MFVFNLLGAQALVWREVAYARNASYLAGQDERIEAFAGVPFLRFNNIDYPFVQPPETFQIESAVEIRHVLFRAPDDPAELITTVAADPALFPSVKARAYAEGQLRGGNRDPALVSAYRALCRAQDQEQEALEFLSAAGLPLTAEGSGERGSASSDGADDAPAAVAQ